MIRLLRAIDNLLEKLIFDVALGTSRRRRIAAALATFCAIAFYGVSGLIFVPVVHGTYLPIDGAPYLTAPSDTTPSLIEQVSREHAIPAGRDAELLAQLAAYESQSGRLISMLATASPPAFQNAPPFRAVRAAANVLNARGVYLALHDQGDAAMLQWITALRFARVVSRGTPTRPPELIPGLVAGAMERVTFENLNWYLKSRMTQSQWRLMQAELRARHQTPHSLRTYMEGERASAARFFAQAHLDGGFAESDFGIYLSRALLPLRHADRAAFMDAVRDRFMKEFDADLAKTRGNRTTATEHGLETDYALLLAPFSREHSIRRMANLLIYCQLPNYSSAGQRLEKIEQQARDLELSAEPLDLEGI